MAECEVLPKNFKPIAYNLEFEPIPQENYFKGKTVIELECLQDSNTLVLNGASFKNIKAKVKEPKEVELKVKEEQEKEYLIFEGILFTKGKYLIEIVYEGALSEKDMCGFYQSKYELKGESKTICSTQFESASARKAFPCFDEPSYKALFDIAMIVPKNEQCFSNMPIKKEEELEGTGKKKVSFETTVKMSTYLICFICGEFTSFTDKTENGISIGFHFPKCYEGVSKFALNTMKNCLTLYENKFKVKFPLPKCDWVAIPSFEAGAMENWGCITSRIIEVVLKEDASISAKKRSASVVCHELAHMWFGNLVTMKWWNDLWLNEGFASFMGDLVGVKNLYPDWKIDDSDYCETVLTALEEDGCEATHPISVPIKKASEIDELFDTISYSKGSSLIAMMANYVGLDTFIEGISNYLNQYKYLNTESNDMWKCVGDVAKIDLISIVKEWTYSPGFPLVTVELKDKKLKLKQERYGCKSDDQIWKIPMTLKYGDYKQNYLFETKEAEIDWEYTGIMVNDNCNGLYRVFYSSELIDELKKQKFNVRETMGIVDDIYQLSLLGKSQLKNYLSFLQSVEPFTPSTYQTARVIIGHLKEIRRRFKYEKIENYIDKEIKRLLEPALKILGNYTKENESTEDAELRSLCLINLEDKNVIEEAINKVINKTINELPSELRRPYMTVASKNANEKVFETLCEIYLKDPVPETQILACRGLGMIKDSNLLEKSLEFSFKYVKLQDFYIPMIFSLFGDSEIPLKFLEKNFDEICNRYSGGMSSIRNNVIEYTLERCNTKEQHDYYKDFFEKRKLEGCGMIMKKGLELILKRYQWIETNKDSLISFVSA